MTQLEAADIENNRQAAEERRLNKAKEDTYDEGEDPYGE